MSNDYKGLMTMKISDFTISRSVAESIEIAFANKWTKTWQLHPTEPCMFHLDGINGCLMIGELQINFPNIFEIDVDKKFGEDKGTLTIMYSDSVYSSYIPVDWYEYEDTDLHPNLGHWHGIYKDSCGWLFAVHEWCDWFEDDEVDIMPDGAVYFETFEPEISIADIEGGIVEPWDGGVMGYAIGDTLEYALSEWISGELKRVA